MYPGTTILLFKICFSIKRIKPQTLSPRIFWCFLGSNIISDWSQRYLIWGGGKGLHRKSAGQGYLYPRNLCFWDLLGFVGVFFLPREKSMLLLSFAHGPVLLADFPPSFSHNWDVASMQNTTSCRKLVPQTLYSWVTHTSLGMGILPWCCHTLVFTRMRSQR